MLPQLYELVNAYNPDILWADLADGLGPASYFKSKEFLAWLYNERYIYSIFLCSCTMPDLDKERR